MGCSHTTSVHIFEGGATGWTRHPWVLAKFAWWSSSLACPCPLLLVRLSYAKCLCLDLGGDSPSCWSTVVEVFLVGRSVARLRASFACPHTVALFNSVLSVGLTRLSYQTPHSHWWCIIIFPRGLMPGAGSPVQLASSIWLEDVAIAAWSSVL